MTIRKRNLLTALSISGLIILGSCKKYEDGPVVSLRSRTERVANNWKVEKAYDEGQDVTDDFDQYDIDLTKDGDATLVAEYEFGGTTFSYETDGTWSFQNNMEEIELDMENDDADEVYQILRLKEKELWVREKGDDLELHLEPR